MISISKTEAATNGNVIIKKHDESDLKTNKSRMTRTSTLDGDVVINHLGVVEGDRTFIVKSNLEKVTCDNLWNIFTNSKFVLISIDEGLFYAAIQDLSIQNGEVKLTILVKSKETD